MAETDVEKLVARASALAATDLATADPASGPKPQSASQVDAAAELVRLAGGDRATLEAARNLVARRLHGHAGDWQATATLTILNRALVDVGWSDPFDWRPRWSMPRLVRAFRRP